MPSLFAQSALLPQGWARDVRITFEALPNTGLITSITPGLTPTPADDLVQTLIPGMPNVHTHSFQRGMAGLAEARGPADDNFWSWRTQMYRFALSMSPDDVEAVAAMLYVEMLESGFTRAAEFHYLHHDTSGRPYANIAEMAHRITVAATDTGIGLTLLPCFYAHATFAGAPPTDGQRRFICSVDSFAALLDASRSAIKNLPGASLGIAPHSLRAVSPEELAALLPLAGTGPIHIHAAEQVKEVDDCLAWSGQRPVEWLLNHAPIDRRWCLIHCTHMTPEEIRRLAASRATVGLCPLTEANLGDGIFAATEFLAENGSVAIGSDSNIQVGVAPELRQLEYSQRLHRRLRNVIAPPFTSTGQTLFTHALAGAAQALQCDTGIAVGREASFVSLSTTNAPQVTQENVLDAWIFTDTITLDSTWVRGQKLVSSGQHVKRQKIAATFRTTLKSLLSRSP